MNAIQFIKDSSEAGSAREVELPTPTASGHDILVEIEAIGLNPVDFKVRPSARSPFSSLSVLAAAELLILFPLGWQTRLGFYFLVLGLRLAAALFLGASIAIGCTPMASPDEPTRRKRRMTHTPFVLMKIVRALPAVPA